MLISDHKWSDYHFWGIFWDLTFLGSHFFVDVSFFDNIWISEYKWYIITEKQWLNDALCVWSFFCVFEGGSGVLHAAGNINTLMMFVNCFIVCSIQFCGVWWVGLRCKNARNDGSRQKIEAAPVKTPTQFESVPRLSIYLHLLLVLSPFIAWWQPFFWNFTTPGRHVAFPFIFAAIPGRPPFL